MSDSQLILSYQSDPFDGRWDLSNLAPMLKHYVQVKVKYPDFKVLFQVGDFYEVFFSDAEDVSQVLGIRLTSRNKSDVNAVPMCGVPIHALDNYLPKLSVAGLKIVLVSQVSDKPVRREVTKVVTPGIRYDAEGLEENSFNYVASVFANYVGSGFLSYIDVGLGKLKILDFDSAEELADLLERISPTELILPSSVEGVSFDRSSEWMQVASKYNCSKAKRLFRNRSLKTVFGDENLSREECLSCGALVDYVEELTFGANFNVAEVERLSSSEGAVVDAATRANLELFSGSKSLFSVVDKTLTPMGSRALRESLATPLKSLDLIEERLDCVQFLISQQLLHVGLKDHLAGVRDLERVGNRLANGRANPADLAYLRNSLSSVLDVRRLLDEYSDEFPTGFPRLAEDLAPVYEKLSSSLLDDPSPKINEGSIICEGYREDLDKLRGLAEDATSSLLRLEAQERENTGIQSLRVKFNSVAGYFIEIPKNQVSKVPDRFQRKQTLAQAERYSTEDLKAFESEVLSAKSKSIELEREIFLELREEILCSVEVILGAATVLGQLDLFSSMASVAVQNKYVRPSFSEKVYELVGGRHPAVETMIPQGRFVSNDTSFSSESRIAVLTGPNMGGKSTYLRQVGLIQLLAQMGSFVPAVSATIPIVDRIFTRIGAADDLSRGESTFMVEMREASAIIRRATSNSLVLIDELGRGTATKDGFAIAASILEYLHNKIRCYCIFATHFHDLTAMEERFEAVFCLQVGVIEEKEKILFTHKILPGSASKSYGLEVARLAGLPKSVLKRAATFLGPEDQVSLPLNIEVEVPEESPVLEELRRIDINSLTPLDALSILSELKQKSED